jgi:hypothetical protein
MKNNDYKLASLSADELELIHKLEQALDVVLIGYEKEETEHTIIR